MKTLLRNTVNIVKPFYSVSLLALMLIAPNAFAQDNPKIAVLDMASALFNSEIAREVDVSVRAETSEDQEKIDSLRTEAQTLQERYQKDEAILSEDEKRSIAEDIQEIGVNFQFLVEKVEKLVQARQEQFQQTYAPNLIQAITDVVEDEGYDIVLRSEVALHFSASYDITAKVTAKLNQQ